MAEHAYQERDYTKAIQFYKEALSHTDNDPKVNTQIKFSCFR